MKKGQTTLFVILGIIIVAVIILAVTFKSSLIKSKAEEEVAETSLYPAEIQQFREEMATCIDNVITTGLILSGLQSGYLEVPKESLYIEDEGVTVAYFYDKGLKKVRNMADMVQELTTAIDESVMQCADPELYPGLDIQAENPSTSIFTGEDLKVSVDYKVAVSANDQSFYLKEPYEYSYLINLGKYFDVINKVIDRKTENPEYDDVDYLLDLGMEIDIDPIDETSEVYAVTDPDSELGEDAYMFMFASRSSQ